MPDVPCFRQSSSCSAPASLPFRTCLQRCVRHWCATSPCHSHQKQDSCGSFPRSLLSYQHQLRLPVERSSVCVQAAKFRVIPHHARAHRHDAFFRATFVTPPLSRCLPCPPRHVLSDNARLESTGEHSTSADRTPLAACAAAAPNGAAIAERRNASGWIAHVPRSSVRTSTHPRQRFRFPRQEDTRSMRPVAPTALPQCGTRLGCARRHRLPATARPRQKSKAVSRLRPAPAAASVPLEPVP